MITNMVDNPTISIITFNKNGINKTTKRQSQTG